MPRLTRAVEYAIKGLLYLALQEGRVVRAEEIAKVHTIPTPYLSKILQTLVRSGMVRSLKGPSGGFTLDSRPEEITLLRIIEAVEGKVCLTECLPGSGHCCFRDCPVKEACQEACLRLTESLGKYTLGDMAAFIKKRE